MAEGSSDPPQLTQDGPSHQKRYGHGSRRGRPRPARHTNLNVDSHIAAKPHGHFQLGSKTNFYDHDGTAGGQNYQHHYQHEEGSRGRGRGGGGRGGRGRGWGNHGSNRGGLLGFTGGVGGPGPRWQRPGGDEGPYGGSSRISAFSGSGHPQSERPDCPGWHREDVGHDPGQANEHQSTRTKRPNRFNQEQGGGEPGMRGIRDAHRRENQNQAAVRDLGFSGLRAGNQHSNFRESSQRSWRGAESTHSDHHRKHFEPNRRQGPIKPPKPFPEVEPGSGSDATAGDEPRQPGRRGWGRQPPPQDRGPRRAPHQEHRPSQKKWDHVPKSKETQTGCLIEQLSEEKYECMVCCDVIRLMAPVWSCQGCHHVFHLNCVKKWARSPASQADDSTEGWRCPACQNVSVKHPTSYTCFCGKVTNPEWRPTEIPHSCGDLCGKKRSSLDCKHACNILCHPGPCPQCPAFITKSCVCGRTSQPMRCGQATVLRCNAVCGAALNCAQHTCPEVCHTAPCQPCQLLVQQVCYCGVASREVLCGTDKEGFDGTGHFSCQKECGKTLDCQAHQCQQLCHTGPCQPCPRSPSLVKTCPCGQTALAKLLELGYPERRSCSDPVPSCGKTCSNPLVCGSNDTFHFCDLLCHEGSCGPCSLTSTVRCRCGSKTKEVPCASIQKEEELVFTCDKRCSKKRACGRHKCTELCCVNAEHKCPLICSYKLNCGLHRCQEPCHRGNCGPCWQASFEELTCHCGQSVLYPPVACGTLPPECKNLCTRRHECEHPVFHNCHSDERCPPCTYLTQKWCMGNHEQRSNIPCHLQDISCGLTCNKTLPCHMHRCRRICHRGDCLAEGTCTQPCAKPRPDCAHPCAALCHWGSDCPRNACTAKVALQCDCGRRKETVMCPEAASSYQRYAAIAMASKLSDMQQGDSVDIGQFITKKELKQARLECDQECATLERNRCLAEALQIDPSVDPFNIRSTSKYSDSLKDDARKELKFVSDVEKEIKNLVELANKGKVSRRSHCFPPMKRDHRKMVHELAEAYGVESVSYDTEPKRNVVVTAIKGKSLCPNTTLTALIERESSARAPPPIAHIKQHSSKADGGGSWSKMVKEEPLIDYFDVQD